MILSPKRDDERPPLGGFPFLFRVVADVPDRTRYVLKPVDETLPLPAGETLRRPLLPVGDVSVRVNSGFDQALGCRALELDDQLLDEEAVPPEDQMNVIRQDRARPDDQARTL